MRFDTVLHLSCEHVLPVFRAASQVTAARHIVAVAREHAGVYEQLQSVFPPTLGHLEKVNVHSEDSAEYVSRLVKVLKGLPKGKVAVHLDGGPRTALLGLLEFTRESNLPRFVSDYGTHTYRWMDTSEPPEPFEPCVRTVADFFRLTGYALDEARSNATTTQAALTRAAARAAFAERDRLSAMSAHVRDFTRHPGQAFRLDPKPVDGAICSATLKHPKDGSKGVLKIGDQTFTVRPWANLAGFICGGWYREAVFDSFANRKETAGALEIRFDCEVICPSPSPGMPARYHADIAWTDGVRLGLVQTLFKPPEMHHLRHLRDAVTGFAHASGLGVLCSLHEDPELERSAACWPEVTTRLGPASVYGAGE